MSITTLPAGRNITPGSLRPRGIFQLKDPPRTCAFLTGQDPILTHSGRFAYDGTGNRTGNTTTADRQKGGQSWILDHPCPLTGKGTDYRPLATDDWFRPCP